MKTVYLSASFPTPERVDESGPFHAADIGAAAASVIEATLRSGANLIFGGHPTITPLVLHIASILNAGAQVTIFQSMFFREQLTEEVYRLSELEGAELIFVPAVGGLERSLAILRKTMFEAPIEVAFFVGGMSGVRDEFMILTDKPETTCITFESPGGMAAKIGAEISMDGTESKLMNLKGRASYMVFVSHGPLHGQGRPVQWENFTVCASRYTRESGSPTSSTISQDN